MVCRKIDEEAGLPGVYGVRQLTELVERGRASVEFRVGGVDVEEVETREGAAVASHSGVCCRDGVDGKKLDDSEAHFADDVVETANYAAEGSGWRNDGVAFAPEGVDCV